MNVRPIAIWCVLFALFAHAADGAGYAAGQCSNPIQTVCDTQSTIASLDGRDALVASVCDFQRAMDTSAERESPDRSDASPVCHATLLGAGAYLSPVTQPLPIGHALDIRALLVRWEELHVEAPIPADIRSLLESRYSRAIAPHAPPKNA